LKILADKKLPFLMYKNKPLVRVGDTLYYGNMSDKYVIQMQVEGSKKQGKLNLADKIIVNLMYTDPELKSRAKVVKKSEKHGLYNAMDIGSIWLERALSD